MVMFGKLFSLCSCGCQKPTPAYKDHVRNIYPPMTAPPQAQNLSDLVRFASSHPKKLKDIGRYLHKRIDLHLHNNQFGYVKVGIEALNVLMETFRSDTNLLTLIDGWVFRCIMLLFSHKNDDMNVLATSALTKLIEYQDEFADHTKLGIFFEKLVRMCEYTCDNADRQYRVRYAGLTALNKVVLFNTEDHVTVDHYHKLIPAVISNLDKNMGQHGGDIDNPNAAASSRFVPHFLSNDGSPSAIERSYVAITTAIAVEAIHETNSRDKNEIVYSNTNDEDNVKVEANALDGASRACFRDLCGLSRFDSVIKLLSSIYTFLDAPPICWQPISFAFNILCCVADCAHVGPDQGYILVTQSLIHLPMCRHDIRLQRRIINVHRRLVLTMRLGIGSWIGLLKVLLLRLREIETFIESEQNNSVVDNLKSLRLSLYELTAACCQRFPRIEDVSTLIENVIIDMKDDIPQTLGQVKSLLRCALFASRMQRYYSSSSTIALDLGPSRRSLSYLLGLGRGERQLFIADILPIIDNLIVPLHDHHHMNHVQLNAWNPFHLAHRSRNKVSQFLVESSARRGELNLNRNSPMALLELPPRQREMNGFNDDGEDDELNDGAIHDSDKIVAQFEFNDDNDDIVDDDVAVDNDAIQLDHIELGIDQAATTTEWKPNCLIFDDDQIAMVYVAIHQYFMSSMTHDSDDNINAGDDDIVSTLTPAHAAQLFRTMTLLLRIHLYQSVIIGFPMVISWHKSLETTRNVNHYDRSRWEAIIIVFILFVSQQIGIEYNANRAVALQLEDCMRSLYQKRLDCDCGPDHLKLIAHFGLVVDENATTNTTMNQNSDKDTFEWGFGVDVIIGLLSQMQFNETNSEQMKMRLHLPFNESDWLKQMMKRQDSNVLMIVPAAAAASSQSSPFLTAKRLPQLIDVQSNDLQQQSINGTTSTCESSIDALTSVTNLNRNFENVNHNNANNYQQVEIEMNYCESSIDQGDGAIMILSSPIVDRFDGDNDDAAPHKSLSTTHLMSILDGRRAPNVDKIALYTLAMRQYELMFRERQMRLDFVMNDRCAKYNDDDDDDELMQLIRHPVVYTESTTTPSLSPLHQRLQIALQHQSMIDVDQNNDNTNNDSSVKISISNHNDDGMDNQQRQQQNRMDMMQSTVFDIPEPSRPSRSQRMLSIFSSSACGDLKDDDDNDNVSSIILLSRQQLVVSPSAKSLFRFQYPRVSILNDSITTSFNLHHNNNNIQ